MVKYDAVMWDLDGTLANTLKDIATAGNAVLAALQRPPIEEDRYRYLAGQGAEHLVREALGPGSEDLVPRALALFKSFQLQHQHKFTTLYPGVAETVVELRRRGAKLAALSNKPDAATHQLMGRLFGKGTFDAVLGHRDGAALKPGPAGALALAKRLRVEPARWLYVGDTRVDMLTAQAAGMFPVGVLWGFRDEAELRDAGAKAIIRAPMDLVGLLEG